MATFYRCDLCNAEVKFKQDLIALTLPMVNIHGQVINRHILSDEPRIKEEEICNSCAQKIADVVIKLKGDKHVSRT
jgi:hypothetical protein